VYTLTFRKQSLSNHVKWYFEIEKNDNHELKQEEAVWKVAITIYTYCFDDTENEHAN